MFDYDNPDLNVYIGDLHAIVKDPTTDERDRSWAKGIIFNFVKGLLNRDDFLLICRRIDNI